MLSYLLHAFSGPSGPFLYALLAIMAFALAVLGERGWTLWRARCDASALIRRAEAAIAQGPQAAAALPMGDTPIEAVARAGLRWSDPDTSFEAMATEAIAAEQTIRRRVAWLSTVASISTMVGLFGTVYGLILAFGALGDVAAAERAARLSEGSSTAMASTAMGLTVAIPALAAHAFVDSWARELLSDVERVAGRIALAWKTRGAAP